MKIILISNLKINQMNKILNQILWNRIISIVEEQAQTLLKTAFSTSVREAGDLSAGIYNKDGLMLGQAVTGTPGHVNAMAESVKHFIKTFGYKNILIDDVYITNNPWQGTGHLHDITIVTPFFFNSKLIGFFACTAHVVDIGGRGFGADANSIYEEGLHIPIMKIFEKGKLETPLIHLIEQNVREPSQVIGDIFALINCNQVGVKRLRIMMKEYHLIDLINLSNYILSISMNSTKKLINKLPKKVVFNDLIIDGYDKPIKLKVKVTIIKNKIICDFSGSSNIDSKGINVPFIYTKAYACYALKCAIAPDVPNNAGSLEPFKILAPDNSIVNAKHPSAVSLRHIIGHIIPDTVFGALYKIIPEIIPAESTGFLCNFQLSIRPRTDKVPPKNCVRSEVLSFNSGGSGARKNQDGLNATAFPSGVMTMPVEATENSGPIIIWKKEFRINSGGAGKFRGGLGQEMEVGVKFGHEFDFQAMFDRKIYPPRGRKGGKNGMKTILKLNDGTDMRGKGKHFVPHGKTVCIFFPGGGGYGDPKKRNKQLIISDINNEFITKQHAKLVYNFKET